RRGSLRPSAHPRTHCSRNRCRTRGCRLLRSVERCLRRCTHRREAEAPGTSGSSKLERPPNTPRGRSAPGPASTYVAGPCLEAELAHTPVEPGLDGRSGDIAVHGTLHLFATSRLLQGGHVPVDHVVESMFTNGELPRRVAHPLAEGRIRDEQVEEGAQRPDL